MCSSDLKKASRKWHLPPICQIWAQPNSPITKFLTSGGSYWLFGCVDAYCQKIRWLSRFERGIVNACRIERGGEEGKTIKPPALSKPRCWVGTVGIRTHPSLPLNTVSHREYFTLLTICAESEQGSFEGIWIFSNEKPKFLNIVWNLIQCR